MRPYSARRSDTRWLRNAPCFVKVHVQIIKHNGVPEILQGLFELRQVIQRQGRQVESDERVPSEFGDDIPAYHVRPVVARGLNSPPNGLLPCH